MAINVYLPAGEGANHMEWVAEAPVPSDYHSEYPPSLLHDYLALEPWQPLVGDVITEDYEVVIDLNQVKNRGAELGTTQYWTVTGFGGFAVTGGGPHPAAPKGTKIFEMQTNSESGNTTFREDIRVRAGEPQSVSIYLASPGAADGEARAYIPELNMWLQPDGSWDDVNVPWASESGSGFVLKGPLATTIPPYSELVPGGCYTVQLTANSVGSSGASAYFDEYVWWGHTNLAAIVGHGLKPALTALEFRRSTDNFVGSNVLESGAFGAPANLRWPTSYSILGGMRTERWVKFLAAGANVLRHWYGQFWVGQHYLLTENPLYGVGVHVQRKQQRQETETGASRVFPMEGIERRDFTLKFKYSLTTEFRLMHQLILRRGQFGAWPALLIYNDTDPGCAAMVRQENVVDINHFYTEFREVRTFELKELGFPVFDDPELAL